MNRNIYLCLILFFVVILAAASPVDSQLVQNECRAGRVWHLEQAWKWSINQGDNRIQDYHLKAAEVFSELETLNEISSCSGWREDSQTSFFNE